MWFLSYLRWIISKNTKSALIRSKWINDIIMNKFAALSPSQLLPFPHLSPCLSFSQYSPPLLRSSSSLGCSKSFTHLVISSLPPLSHPPHPSNTLRHTDWETHSFSDTHAVADKFAQRSRHHTLAESRLVALWGYTPVCSGSWSNWTEWARTHFLTGRYRWGWFGFFSGTHTKTHTMSIYWQMNHQICQVAYRLINPQSPIFSCLCVL